MSITAIQKPRMARKHNRPPVLLQFFIGFFLFVFLLGGLYSGYLFYATIREIVARAELPAMSLIQIPIRLPEPAAKEQAAAVELPPQLPAMTPAAGNIPLTYQQSQPPLIMADRINILLLGIDRRGGQGWGYRTDTIIIVTVDEGHETAGMLSIPRDLQLEIPGYKEDRINTANVYGESSRYPGGGPALLERTIEYNFGIPIDYYIMVDFQGFEQIIDTLGGIDIDVPRTLHDTQYPDPLPGDPYHYKTIHFDPGLQRMNGKRALQYARSRMSTSDFDRARRQQQILIAIRDKALSLNLLPKLPSLIATMGNMVRTDMTPDDMIRLARLAPQIDIGTVRQVVLQKPYVYGYRRSDGAAVQLPKWDLINQLVADLFAAPLVVASPTATPAPPTPTPTLAPVQIDELQKLAADGARIAIQNGTSEPNFAARVAAMLLEQGYQVVEFGDADRMDYGNTVIVDYTGKTYTLGRLVDLFRVAPENVRQSPNVRSQIDIRVIVGQDFLLSLP